MEPQSSAAPNKSQQAGCSCSPTWSWSRCPSVHDPADGQMSVQSKKRVSFGCVTVSEFTVTLDDSKLTSDGLSPLGLGQLQQTLEFASAEAFSERGGRGVSHMDDCERRKRLLGDGALSESEMMEAVAALEAVEAANRVIRGQTITTYERDLEYENETAADWRSPVKLSDKPRVPLYATAEADASRDGVGGGFDERDAEEEAR